MNKKIKILLVLLLALLIFVAASTILVLRMKKASNIVEWSPADIQQEVEQHKGNEKKCDDPTRCDWQWKETVFNNDTKQSPKNSESFVLTFQDEESFLLAMGCGNIAGKFKTEKSRMSFKDVEMVDSSCSEEILQSEFIKTLKETGGYFINQEGQLILELPFDTGSMIFEANGK